MCFEKKWWFKNHKTAERKIRCYKIMKLANGRLKSFVCKNNKDYLEGDMMYPEVNVDVSVLDSLDELTFGVIHSFSFNGRTIKQVKSDLRKKDVHILWGGMCSSTVMVVCEIPKGTPYWEDVNYFASTKLKIKEIISVI